MAANYIQAGSTIEWTNGTGSAVSSGGVVAVGDQGVIGVAAVDIADGATGTVHIEGVFEVPCASASVVAVGDILDWDASGGEFVASVTAASGDIENAVMATSASANGVTLVDVKLNVQVGTYTS